MATILENEAAWSTTAATNANVDTGINWAENQDAAMVNNSARGMMAARRKAALDQGGALVAAGTNALTVTTNQVLSTAHLMDGMRLTVRAPSANTTVAVTFAPDGLTAAPIKRADGSALAIGAISAGMLLDLAYNSGSSEWRAVNIPPGASTSGAVRASFSAAMGSDQAAASGVGTFIAFNSTTYNVGSYFNTGSWTWTPPAGSCSLILRLYATNVINGALGFVEIRKNGALIKYGATISNASGNTAIGDHILIDQCNGSDYYQGYIACNTPSGNLTVVAAYSYFLGTMI